MAYSLSSLLPFFGTLAVILVVAHTLGSLSGRLGFAPVVGELVTGLVLGPSLLGVVAPGVAALFLPVDERVAGVASLGLVFLVVLAGTEIDGARLKRSLGPTAAVAIGGTVVPFFGGFALAWVLPASFLADPARRFEFALFLGTALSISALPVAVRVLVDLDALDTRVGQLTLTTAVVIDAAGWLLLTVVADVVRTGRPELARIGETVVLLVGFALLVTVVGRRVAAALFDATAWTRSPALTEFSVVIVVALGVTAGAVALGLEAVVGAFLAGLVVSHRLEVGPRHVFQTVTLGLFAPVFFATAGLRADLTSLLTPGAFAVALATLAVAIAGKFVGVALGAAVTDLTRGETVALAVGLNARGAMEIVVAAVGLSLGVLTPLLYAVVVLVAVLTSVMTPPLLRRSLDRLPPTARQ
ncbi:cation:proton antiporter [Haloarcula marina]|uniref:cation:proton antiporter n=1 Tax=Haloarcula marina TaxID=2961574 RepID=UPI0020B6EFAB|nr:cation:proton antiporter [Halomicroarcula marina]